jgi:hypothetical protein
MKKTFFITLLSAVLFTISCSNDFEVAAPWKDIPVVYGLLNIQDHAHYIRVEKAFLDPEANALEIAQIPDSIYYANLTVQLERVSDGQLFTMTRVDGNLEGLPREDGIFATSPNWLYKIDSSAIKLQAGETIRLKIDRGDELPEITGETVILNKGKLRSPDPNTSNNFNFDYNIDTKLAWSGDPNARIFDAKLIFKYAEISGTEVEEKSFEWIWGRGIRNENNSAEIIVMKKGREFYEVVKNNIPVKPGVSRVFQGIDVEIVAGGTALEKYVNIALANTGITGSQEIPTYTNLSEGKGVFSSINYLTVNNILLTQRSRDSLENGILTKNLNF